MGIVVLGDESGCRSAVHSLRKKPRLDSCHGRRDCPGQGVMGQSGQKGGVGGGAVRGEPRSSSRLRDTQT